MRQLDWVAATENRVNTIAYCTSCLKGIRMLGLTDMVHSIITSLREAEIVASNFVMKLMTWVFVISNVLFQVTLFATYITFAIMMLYGGSILNFQVLFTSLSALKLVTTPIFSTLQAIPVVQSSAASLQRIQDYLNNGEYAASIGRDVQPWSTFSEGIELVRPSNAGKANQESSVALEVCGGTFEVQAGQPLLLDINLQLRTGSFTMVIGRVASGKSVLLHSLVGEVPMTNGQLKTPSSGISFCVQSPWLRNATLRDNILGESPFEQSWYDTVCWACGLQRDFKEQKNADATLVGSRGISLSGGQKNRMSLARALYARKPMLIVDDVLSGLDNATENLVFTRAFGKNGLVRKAGVTTILATHSTHFAPQSDKLVVLSGGRIIADGTYSELASRPGFLGKHSLNTNDSDVSSDGDTIREQDITEALERKVISDPVNDTSSDQDGSDRRRGDMRTLVYFLSCIGKKQVSIYMILMVTASAMTAVQYIYLQELAKASTTPASLKKQVGWFTAITVVDIVSVGLWLTHFTLVFCPRSSLSLHARQLAALMHARFSYLVATDTGSITNRFSQDIVLIDRQLVFAWVNMTSLLCKQISTFGIAIAATPPIAGLVPFLGLASYVIQRVYLRTSRQIRLMDLEAKAPLCTNFLETLAGIVTIRAFGWTEAYRARNKRLLDESQVPFYLLNAIQNWLKLVLELMVAGLVVVLMGLAIGLRTKVDAGYLGLALVGAMDMGGTVRMLVTSWTDLETALSAVARIRQFATCTPSEKDDLLTQSIDPFWPATGAIEFCNLTAAYSESSAPVIRDINLTIRHGEKIGICGRTGSGKSSLVAALFKLLHQTGGQINIDGVLTDSVPLSLLRSKIIALPQEPFFLKGTVRANLNPWETSDTLAREMVHMTDENMIHALEQVGLWAKFTELASLEGNGLDVRLDNVDALLSQGEKQLFCLARATLQQGRIVVLDEATSSVDAATDALMQSILRSAFADRTVIAIAHRLHTILDFDRVVVMENGEIIEIGEPKVLMEIEGSRFRTLVERQGKR